MERLNLLNDCEDRLLNDLLRLDIRQACFEPGGINQSPVGIKELSPALLGVRLLEATEQTVPCRHR